jgi:spore germination protein KC
VKILQPVKNSIFLLEISSLLFLVGCWDRTEINDIGIITATALDYANEEELELTVEIVIPEAMSAAIKEGSNGGGRSTFVESAKGVTLADARSKLQSKIARTLFWGHNEATVIGKRLAEQGIREHIDFFARMPETRLRNVVYVSEDEAKEVISSLPHLEDTAAETLRELSEFKSGLNINMKDLFQMLKSETGQTVLPLIRVEASNGQGKVKDKRQLNMNGAALFKGDKLIGTLDQGETRGLLWVRNEIKEATVTLDVKDGEGKISMEMIRSSTELEPRIENGRWKMKLKIVTVDDIIQNTSTLDLRNPMFIQQIRQQAKKDIENRVAGTILVAQEKKLDVLRFGESFRRKYPKEWQQAKDNWEEIFPNIEVDYDITVRILRPGESSQSPSLPKERVKKG